MSIDVLGPGASGRPSDPRGPADAMAGAADKGLAAAFDQLFRDQAPRLLRFFSRRAAGRDEAADLLQETFARLIRLASVQEAPRNPEAYLQRIAMNLVRDRARQAASDVHRLTAPLDEETLADPGPDPHRQLEAREMLERYELALRGLKPKTRTIFLRHRLDGLTYAQIAQDLDQSVSCVEKHMMKAIAHLDRVFGRL